ncbi:nuclear transport factor 2 family protein [Amycolatopsis carbonis]|uniref:Nuclear transport factor 2 family protein n=1 Tax=Amycolatopsis carbonis TaxID=715471 RepID=A0A9Y2IBK1_9PSEU|nr:nuclear transport factor 2 family protein [Amycolatopsis sp. 2-15]WIX77062.1 nuclear transport factor 2 family protein [Amycolatopsis sp. 2-15]
MLEGFADEATMTYGSNDPMAGRDAIRGGLEWLFTTYSRMRHEFRNLWSSGAVLLLEANVTYVRPDGREVTLPVVTIIEHRDGIIGGLRIFIDPTPTQVG